MSDSLWPHESQHARPPCPSPTPGVCPNSCPLSWWCHPNISSSVAPFSSCFQSFPGLESFPVNWLFTSDSQRIGASVSISPSSQYSGLMSILWSPYSEGTLKSLFQHHSLKASILQHSAFFMVQLSHLYMTTGKTTALTIQTFVSKMMSLLFNTLSRFVIAILTRTKHLLIWNIIIEIDLIDAWNRPSVTSEVRISKLICPVSW